MEKTELLNCPICGGRIQMFKGIPKGKWSITFKCKGSCGFKFSHEEYRKNYQSEYIERMILQWNNPNYKV